MNKELLSLLLKLGFKYNTHFGTGMYVLNKESCFKSDDGRYLYDLDFESDLDFVIETYDIKIIICFIKEKFKHKIREYKINNLLNG